MNKTVAQKKCPFLSENGSFRTRTNWRREDSDPRSDYSDNTLAGCRFQYSAISPHSGRVCQHLFENQISRLHLLWHTQRRHHDMNIQKILPIFGLFLEFFGHRFCSADCFGFPHIFSIWMGRNQTHRKNTACRKKEIWLRSIICSFSIRSFVSPTTILILLGVIFPLFLPFF